MHRLESQTGVDSTKSLTSHMYLYTLTLRFSPSVKCFNNSFFVFLFNRINLLYFSCINYVAATAGAWVLYTESLVWVFTRWSVKGDLVSTVSVQRSGVKELQVFDLSKAALEKLPSMVVQPLAEVEQSTI